MSLEAAARLPYPGLRSFRREESDLFFGRDDCIGTMVDRLAASRLLAVLGSSGTGKSSLVKTGLLDALDLGLMAEAGSDWRVVDFAPGAAPQRNLARRLLETERDGTASESDVELLRAFLLRGPRAVAEWASEGHLPPGQNLLMLVDQFEELFRFQDYAGREEGEAFVALMIESARLTGSRIYVVLTMRSEFLGACSLIDGLAEAIAAGLYLIPRMKRVQCREAIVGPATNCGFEIDDGLVNRLLNDLAAFAPWDDTGGQGRLERLGRRADQLPLLQYCLNQMWVRAREAGANGRIRLTLADYERIGALGGALNAHANEILSTLGEGRLAIAEKVFRALTEGATVADAVRRPTRLGELVEICDGEEPAVRAVVDAFRAPGCNFLTPEPDPNHPTVLPLGRIVDISHESLIRQWRRFPAWLEAEARSVRTWRRLRERFDDGDVLQANELANLRLWRETQKPNAAWARRYGGDFAATMAFIETSERRRSRFAPVIMPLIGVATLVISFLVLFGLWFVFVSEKDAPPFLTVLFVSVTSANTCVLGLALYRGLRARRAFLAAATIFLAEGLTAAVLIFAYAAVGSMANSALTAWIVGAAAPVAVTLMGIFDPQFRRLSRWLPLAASWSFIALIATTATKMDLRGMFADMAIWFLWCALFGYLLRRPVDEAALRKRRPALTALKLGSMFFAWLVLAVIWALTALSPFYGVNTNTWPWWANPIPGTAAVALTLALGLRKYRGLDARSAFLAGAIIFALAYIGYCSGAAGLQSRGLAREVAGQWATLIVTGPAVLVVLAGFDRAFRRPWIWLTFIALFAIPYAAAILSVDVTRSPQAATLGVWLLILLFTLWFAALGYAFRRLPPTQNLRAAR